MAITLYNTPEAPAYGSRRTCYVNFAGHLQNSYNPNVLYPGLPNEWSDADWRRFLDAVADFGFTAFEFWLVPAMFSPDAFDSEAGRRFADRMDRVCEEAHTRGLDVNALVGLATVGSSWRTYCPNDPSEWATVRSLWDRWTRRLSGLDVVGIFPGDPGACSRNGCTAETFIDRACEVAGVVSKNLSDSEVELHTWGPPFFGWGIIEAPDGWSGEFIREHQASAWRFDPARAERSMRHLLLRLPDFPSETSVAMNLAFTPDGNPDSPADARGWAQEIATIRPIQTWDFSLTEGENAVLPHWRFDRLFAARRLERQSAPYRGGIAYTMTPRLNQLSLYLSARSFADPDAEPKALARSFYSRLFGPDGEGLVEDLPVFEEVPDWGNYAQQGLSRSGIHAAALRLVDRLEGLAGGEQDVPSFPDPDEYRRELLWFSRFFADATGADADRDELIARYWGKVYAIYDRLGEHVDSRPRPATENLVDSLLGTPKRQEPMLGKWTWEQ